MGEYGQIDIARTVEAYGYHPSTLKPNSCKPVIVNCIDCLEERVKQFRSALSQPSCLRCANMERAVSTSKKRSASMKAFYASGGVHPMKGRKHSDEAKAALREFRLNHPMSQETKDKLRATWLAKKWKPTPEVVAASKLRRGPLAYNYGKTPAHTNKVWYEKADGSKVCFRSTWEAHFAKWLDSRGLDWQYEPEAFPIEVELNGIRYDWTYTPDFKVGDHWYEVKGRWTLEGLIKYEAFVALHGQSSITVCDRKWFNDNGIKLK